MQSTITITVIRPSMEQLFVDWYSKVTIDAAVIATFATDVTASDQHLSENATKSRIVVVGFVTV